MWCSGGCTSKSEREFKARRKEVNARINAQIQKDRLVNSCTNRVLLLGTPNSGKSTILKQMRILEGDGFSDDEKRLQLEHIKRNIRDAILSIAGVLSTSTPPVALEHPENQLTLDYIQSMASQPDFEYSSEFYEHAENLWKDKGVQSCFERSNEYRLADNAKYFLDKVFEIKQPSYLPSEEDILRCRAPTLGIFESRLHLHNVYFHLFEVGEQCDGRRKLLRYFNDVNAIIFVADCSSFNNTILGEDENTSCQTRLDESLELFRSIWNNYWYRELPVILFLNKQDLLKEKVKDGKSKLEDYFPDFAHYQIPATDATPGPGDVHEYIRARHFIRDEFLRISRSSGKDRHCRYDNCYPIFTSALEKENILRVFDICYDLRTAFSRDHYPYNHIQPI